MLLELISKMIWRKVMSRSKNLKAGLVITDRKRIVEAVRDGEGCTADECGAPRRRAVDMSKRGGPSELKALR